MDAEFLEHVVPNYPLTVRFDLQDFQFTDWFNNGPSTGYKQPQSFEHIQIPERFARVLKRCDAFISDNQLWTDQLMARLGVALEDMPDLQSVRLHWAHECKANPGDDRFFRAVRHLNLEASTWAGLSPSIDVTSLPDVTVKECEMQHENYC